MVREHHQLAASCTPPPRDSACNLGVRPDLDQESKRDILVHGSALNHLATPLGFLTVF